MVLNGIKIDAAAYTHILNQMKRTILALAFLATLAACKKNPDETSKPNPDEKLSPDIALSVKGATQESLPLYQWSQTYNFLGFGYDVTENFNNESSVRANVVNMPAYAAGVASRVSLDRSTQSSWTTIEAKNAEDLSEKFSNSFIGTKGFKLYGGTAQSSFPETVATDKKFVYGYYSYYMIWGRNKFYYDQSVNAFLTDNFKKDITLLSAEALVGKYGTHVLAGIRIGAKFDVVYQAQASEGDRELISMEGLRYALRKTFGLTSGALDNTNLRNLNANSSAQIYYSSIGGDISKLKTETINNRPVINITNWTYSCTEDKARFIGILDNGLVPLYNFIDDTTKKAEVKAYIEQYFVAKTVKLKN